MSTYDFFVIDIDQGPDNPVEFNLQSYAYVPSNTYCVYQEPVSEITLNDGVEASISDDLFEGIYSTGQILACWDGTTVGLKDYLWKVTLPDGSEHV